MAEVFGAAKDFVTKLTVGYPCEQKHAHNNEEDARICNKIAERERQKLEKEIAEKAELQKENQKLRDELTSEKLREMQKIEKEIAEKAELQKEIQKLRDDLTSEKLRTTSQCCVVS